MYYLYVIKMEVEETEKEYLKIGYSKDVTKRKAQLQGASPFLLRCIQLAGPFKLRTVRLMEKNLHELFHKKRRFGEWFCVDSDDVFTELVELTKQSNEEANVAGFRY